jgi:hypothetical protein
MRHSEIVNYRLASQHIAQLNNLSKRPEDVLASMGAMQAQDYNAALWAIGLRCKKCTLKDVQNAIAQKKIVRTWLMRGTIHFAASNDIHWMLGLFAPRLLTTAISRDRRLGLSDKAVEDAKKAFAKELGKKGQLTRDEMYKVLEKCGISTAANPLGYQLGYHMLYRAAWDGVICFGAHDGKQPTFVLLDKWVTKRDVHSSEEALAKLASRYFTSHGPATIKDYVWWSGLKVSDAKIGIGKASPKLVSEEIDGKTYYYQKLPNVKKNGKEVHLLPAFDEYIVSYNDRSALLSNPNTQKALKSGKVTFIHSNGVFLPTIVIDGEVVGTWKRKNAKGKAVLTMQPFLKLNKEQISGVKEAAAKYENFLQMPVDLKI